jgi:phage-related protein
MMQSGSEWTVEFYEEDDGSTPVLEFLAHLDAKTQLRFEWSIEQLRVRNVAAREPLARHIEDKIWEIREESNTRTYRVLYFFFTGRRIVLLHGFEKKTERTPRREIEMAQRRLDQFVEREAQ